MVISCSGKFHAFALAEQMQRKAILGTFFTTYASGKNNVLRKFVGRTDKEEIPVEKICTNTLLAFPIKLWQSKVHLWNNYFDLWVAGKLDRNSGKIFTGWSGMSLQSICKAKQLGMVTILERGSTHILFQNNILREEYKRFNKEFSIHSSVIRKELQEYEETDYISVPSDFVKNSFIDQGIPAGKLLLNPYGAGKYFKPVKNERSGRKFTILYMGTISIRKGLIYLFEALEKLDIKERDFEVCILGSIDRDMEPVVNRYRKANWRLMGHVDHYSLAEFLSECDIGVQPSLEEGLSMVIPQMMSCGLPVIITENTGGGNIVTSGLNGFILKARDVDAMKAHIEFLYHHPVKLAEMKEEATKAIASGFTWDDYGDRYFKNLQKIV